MDVVVDKESVMKALLNKISEVLTAGDKAGSLSKNFFISWCSPGIPFQAEDLMFVQKGLKGKDAQETGQLMRNAADFSRLVNLVPKLAGVYDRKQQQETSEHKYNETTYDQRGVTLEDVYANVLKNSQVHDTPLTPQQEEKINKFRKMMTIEVPGIIDENIKTIKDSPLVAAYKAKEADYLNALTAYNNKRLSALNEESSQAIQDFAVNGEGYYRLVKSALNDWISSGYKNEYEEMIAYINQATQKSLKQVKSDLQIKFDQALLKDSMTGDFRATYFYPGSFVTSDKGWTEVSFSESSVASYDKSTTNSWEINAGLLYKIFLGDASSSGTITNSNSSLKTSNLTFKFKLAQLVLSRPWFSQSFLENSAWRFSPTSGQSPLSLGSVDPTQEDNNCQLPAIPTAVIFAKDIEVYFDELASEKSQIESQIKAGLTLGIGPFSLGGSYSRGSAEKKIDSKFTDQGIKVDGMQIIGFKCALLPKSPNPPKDLQTSTNWV